MPDQSGKTGEQAGDWKVWKPQYKKKKKKSLRNYLFSFKKIWGD